MPENKPVVESIKIGTLDKQIEILEQLGLTKSEITNLIYDTQGQITAENTDTLDIIIQQFTKILEQDELKTIEELARTLLANQSEASVKYVLSHELIGKVFKHILKSDNSSFDNSLLEDVIADKDMMTEIVLHDELPNILYNSRDFISQINNSKESSSLCGGTPEILQVIVKYEYAMRMMKDNKHFLDAILAENSTADILVDSEYSYIIFKSPTFKESVNSTSALNSIVVELDTLSKYVKHQEFIESIANSDIWFNELKDVKYADTILSNDTASQLGRINVKWRTLFATKHNGWLGKLLEGDNRFKNAYSSELGETIINLNGSFTEFKVNSKDGEKTIYGKFFPIYMYDSVPDVISGGKAKKGKAMPQSLDVFTEFGFNKFEWLTTHSELAKAILLHQEQGSPFGGATYKVAYYYKWEEMV